MNRLSPGETNALRCLLLASFVFNTCVLLNRLQLPLGTQIIFKLKTPPGFEPINRNVHTLKEAVGMIMPTYCCRCLWFCDKVLALIRFSNILSYSATVLLLAPFQDATGQNKPDKEFRLSCCLHLSTLLTASHSRSNAVRRQ